MEFFGTKLQDGKFMPFSTYSMRQAIEEGFIIDVLENYTTYKTYWNLLKTIEQDPHYMRDKASAIIKSFVELHEHSISKKIEIIETYSMIKFYHNLILDKISSFLL